MDFYQHNDRVFLSGREVFGVEKETAVREFNEWFDREFELADDDV